MERLLDRVAVGLRLDRAEVRKRNLVRREQMPCSKPFKTRAGVPVVIDSGDLSGMSGQGSCASRLERLFAAAEPKPESADGM